MNQFPIDLRPQSIAGFLDGSINAWREPIKTSIKSKIHSLWKEGDRYYIQGEATNDLVFTNPRYKIGDVLVGREEWRFIANKVWYDEENFKVIDIDTIIRLTKSGILSSKCNNPQPASTMPLEFSRIRREIIGIEAQKLGEMRDDLYSYDLEIDAEGLILAGNAYAGEGDHFLAEECWSSIVDAYKYHWNTLHSSTPYDPELWTWKFKLEEVKEKK